MFLSSFTKWTLICYFSSNRSRIIITLHSHSRLRESREDDADDAIRPYGSTARRDDQPEAACAQLLLLWWSVFFLFGGGSEYFTYVRSARVECIILENARDVGGCVEME